MKLKCLGSSSAGNCYILEYDKEALIIEAGIPLKEVKKALNFNISKIVGVIVSHAHKDHSGYISDYMKAGIEGYTSDETQEYLEISTGEYTRSLMPNKAYKIGNFTVQAFELIHDVHCLGFYIKHEEIGKLLFITDTELVIQNFKSLNVNHILIEANYSNETIDKTKPNYEHVLTGHMELETTLNFLEKNKTPNLENAVLIHLSESNSNSDMFLNRAKEVVSCNCFIANKGLEVELKLVPFL